MPYAPAAAAHRLRQNNLFCKIAYFNILMTFPDPTENYFTLLGVGVGTDDATLTARFHALTRQFHPDRFVTEDEEIQEQALDATALINNAYRILKDPFARAEYLLQYERNIKIDDLKGNPPQSLFAEVLEIQEMVLEYHEAKERGDISEQTRLKTQLMVSKSSFEVGYEEIRSDLHALLAQWPDANSMTNTENQNALLDAMTDIIATRRYLRRVITNLENL